MEGKLRILIAEDEEDLCEIVQFNLESEGYTVEAVHSAEDALKKDLASYDLLLLDVMMGKISGIGLAQRVRKEMGLEVPVIFLTARNSENDLLTGFNIGADDYITKPFSIKRVLARVAALFRGRQIAETTSQVVVIGPVSLDAGRHEVCVEGQPVAVTAAEFRLLKVLMSARGRVLSREQLIDMVMGVSVAVTDRVIDVHVSALRKKLGPAAGWVHTIRGVGYAFRPPLAEE